MKEGHESPRSGRNQSFSVGRLILLSVAVGIGFCMPRFGGAVESISLPSEVYPSEGYKATIQAKIIVARDGHETTVTILTDYSGDPDHFVFFLPVPPTFSTDQFHTVSWALFEDVFSFSRAAQTHVSDPDPCPPPPVPERHILCCKSFGPPPAAEIQYLYEAQDYALDLISARNSGQMQQFFTSGKYSLDENSKADLESYLRHGFNLLVLTAKEQRKSDWAAYKREARGPIRFLVRPFQIRYRSETFVLPLGFGLTNSNLPQNIDLMFLSRTARIEPKNYPISSMPSSVHLPIGAGPLGAIHEGIVDHLAAGTGRGVAVLEYAAPAEACLYCSRPNELHNSLTPTELVTLGIGEGASKWPWSKPPAAEDWKVFVAAYTLRYERGRFPDDMVFAETYDRTSLHTEYVSREPWHGPSACPAGQAYRQSEAGRQAKEWRDLADLTGWYPGEIRLEEPMAPWQTELLPDP